MDQKALKEVLQSFPYGLFVVGSLDGTKVSTNVVNWVTQVSFHPPLVLVAIEHDSRMRLHIENTKSFSLNLLRSGSMAMAKALLKDADPIGNTKNGQAFTLGVLGLPIFNEASTVIECKVVSANQVGDHVTFVGEVVNAVIRHEGEVLTLKETGWRYAR